MYGSEAESDIGYSTQEQGRLIPQKMSKLDAELNELEQNLHMLVESLESVLEPNSPMAVAPDKEPRPDREQQSDLADQLDSVLSRVNACGRLAHRTKTRVQV